MLQIFKFRSLAQQLAFALVVTLFLSVVIIAMIQSKRIEDSNREVKLREMEGLSQAIGSSALIHLSSSDIVALETLLQNLNLFKDIKSVAIIDENNRVVSEVTRAPGGEMLPTFNVRVVSPPEVADVLIQQQAQEIVYWHPFGTPLTASGWVVLTVDMLFLEKIKTENRSFILMSGFVLFLATFFVLYAFLSKRVRAIQKLTQFADKLSSEVGSQVEEEQGAVELNDLAMALNASSAKLEKQSRELEHQKTELVKSNAMLVDRVRQINLIYSVSKILADPELKPEAKIQQVVEQLPPVVQLNCQVSSRIKLWGKDYTSDSFQEGRRLIRSDILVNNGTVGCVEVFCIDDAEPAVDVSGIQEQKNLVEEIAVRLAIFFRNQEFRFGLAQSNEELERQVAERTKDLEAALLEAKDASKSKSEFLSRVSHELRTPMNAVMGFAQVLQADAHQPLSDDQRESVQYILDAGSHLLELINEILDLTRIEHGSVTINRKSVHIKPLVQSVVNLLTSLAGEKDVTLHIVDEAPSDLEVNTDEGKLRQILINLIGNAIKYNRIGGKVYIAAAFDGNNSFALTVKDTGIGIPHERLEEIFDPFVQLNEVSVEGAGIGLSVVKRLVELLDVKIEVESNRNRGTTFRLIIPLN